MPTPTTPGIKNPLKYTQGGFNTACIYSGSATPAVAPGLAAAPGAFAVGSDVMLFSGAGRLDQIVPHLNTLHSGTVLSIVFYDAAAPVSGGPIPASGHKLIFATPSYLSPASGGLGLLSSGNVPVYNFFGQAFTPEFAFQSGLCFNARSGQGGFSVAWTPELANQ